MIAREQHEIAAVLQELGMDAQLIAQMTKGVSNDTNTSKQK